MLNEAGWEWRQAEDERYKAACEAIDRCAKAGADLDDLKTLARECGVNIQHTVLGETHAAHK